MPTSIAYLEQMLANANIRAALATIRHTEGTDAADGYNYIFGSSPRNTLRFAGYAQHPNNRQVHNGIGSTAAGAYQFLYGTWADLCKKYGFTDFGPRTQDLMCLAIFDTIGVLGDIAKGYLLRENVMTRLSAQWASLPYAKYGQPTHTIANVRDYYTKAGGTIG